MTIRSECPRCVRVVARRASGKHHDHLDPETGEWCTQAPKSIYGLMSDLLDSIRLERQELAALSEIYVTLGAEIVTRTAAHTGHMTKSTEIMHRITKELNRLTAEKQNSYTSLRERAKKFGNERVGGHPDC